MNEQTYRALAEHLNRLPGRLPAQQHRRRPAPAGNAFYPAGGGLAVHLTLAREHAEAIAARAGLPPEQAEPMLEQMAQKGLVFSCQDADGEIALPGRPDGGRDLRVPGQDMTPELLRRLSRLLGLRPGRPAGRDHPADAHHPGWGEHRPVLQALPYEQVYALVDAHEQFAVTPCICRPPRIMRRRLPGSRGELPGIRRLGRLLRAHRARPLPRPRRGAGEFGPGRRRQPGAPAEQLANRRLHLHLLRVLLRRAARAEAIPARPDAPPAPSSPTWMPRPARAAGPAWIAARWMR